MCFSETVDFTGGAGDVTDRAGGVRSIEMEAVMRNALRTSSGLRPATVQTDSYAYLRVMCNVGQRQPTT